MVGKTLILLIPQCPMDSASGAALVERTTCEMLAQSGWDVRVIGTTATESADPDTALRALRALNCEIRCWPFGVAREVRVMEFSCRGVLYRLLDTAGASVNEARTKYTAELDMLLEAALAERIPDVLATFGSNRSEILRRARARRAGARVVLSIHNFAYVSRDAFAETDIVLTPSRFVTRHYQRTHGLDSLPLPVPLSVQEVTAPSILPLFFTFVNPTPVKGVHFFLRVAQLCADRWPDLPFLVVESRGSAAGLVHAARQCGVDILVLNLRVARNTPNPAEIYAVTRVIVMPSLKEPGGRVAAEAMVNGIPVVASDRGGLPEIVCPAGFVLPVSLQFDAPEAAAAIDAWANMLGRLYTDPEFYADAARRAIEHTAQYRNGKLVRERVDVFERIARGENISNFEESFVSLASTS